jgi:thiamine biosynthesis lipoprotein
VIVDGPGADARVAQAGRLLNDWHHRFSRFEPDSEISALNADPRATIAVTPLMARIVAAAVGAAERTGGLVDPTLVTEIERAGYAGHFDGIGLDLGDALAIAPARNPGGGHPLARWSRIAVDRAAGTVTRPPGTRIDAGGIAKGVFADELAALMADADAFAIDCAGDIRLGGAGSRPRAVLVESPFDRSIMHELELTAGGVATSGIGRRSWLGPDGAPAHHLLDPATGKPAFTGVVQATAVAPTATEAEALSKAALLSGPAAAGRWLPHGGVIVLEDGGYEVVEPRTPAGASWAASQSRMSSSTCSCSGSLRISW